MNVSERSPEESSMHYSIPRLFKPLLGPVLLLTLSFPVMAQTDQLSTSIQQLQSSDADIRLTAVRELLRRTDDLQARAHNAVLEMGPIVVEPLCRILLDEDDPLRYYAVHLLTKIRDERAITSLISVLGVQVSGIGPLAATALVGIGKPAVDDLIVCLTSHDPVVRKLASEALGMLKDERAFESLLTTLKDEDLDVRRQALLAVMNFQSDQVSEAAVTALHDPGLLVEASLFLGAKKDLRVLPYLLETLRGSDPLDAQRAQHVLASIGEPAIEELILVLRDRNPEYPMREVRRKMEEAKHWPGFLGRCGNEPPPPILDPRRLAAIALGQIGDERAITALTEALNDESSHLRADAATALARLSGAGH
jgi:HEAT repeat protein